MTLDARILSALGRQVIELPSWAFGNSGTRFKVFGQPGVPRDPFEKISDAAEVHRLTALAPSVALHIPWDRVDDFCKLREHAESLGVRLGTINSNTFQSDEFKLGSLAHADPAIRRRRDRSSLRVHRCHGPDRARPTSRSGWPTAPTTPAKTTCANAKTASPSRWRRCTRGSAITNGWCSSTSSSSPRSTTPMFPTGARRSPTASRSASERWCASTPGTMRSAPTSSSSSTQLLRLGRLGAFDFNSRFYADDDLIVGAADPFQLFRILYEVVRGGGYEPDSGITFMLDQCHNIEQKIPGQIRSVLNVQEMMARALLVDRDALAAAQRSGEVLAANAVFMDAFFTDVRPALADWREERGLPRDPICRVHGLRLPTSTSRPRASVAFKPVGVPDLTRRAGLLARCRAK